MKRKKPTGYAEQMRMLRSNLHYQQMYVRMELRSAAERKKRVKEIAAKMRKLQHVLESEL